MIRLFGHYVSKVYLLLGLLELLACFYSPIAGYFLRFGLQDPTDSISGYSIWLVSGLYALLMSVSMVSVGLYQRGLPFSAGVLIRIGLSFLFASMAMSLVFFTFPELALSRGVMAYAMLFTLVGLLGLRSLFFRLTGVEAQSHRVMVLGTGQHAKMIADLNGGGSGFLVVGYVHVCDQEDKVPEQLHLNKEGTLLELVVANGVDELVVALDDRRQCLPVDEILDCKMSGVEVMDLLGFFEKETSRIKLDILHPGWIIFSDGFHLDGLGQYSKRLLDICGSLLILLVGLPFMLLVALAIWLESGGSGPVLFHQTRMGLNGKHFQVHKFRSMRMDAEADGVARWAQENDSRITRTGAFIRKTRLDELPQLFNILRGDMSLVGPRPERPEFVQQLAKEIPFYHERHRVKPGLTGWAQLSYQYGSTTDDARHKLEFDLYYVKNASLFLDLIVLLETVEIVLWGKGAH